MKTLLIACSLFFSVYAIAQENVLEISSSEASYNKSVVRRSHSYGIVAVNTTSTMTYNVTNTGTIPLYFQRASLAGREFYVHHNCAGSLNPGQKCYFRISYAPMMTGYHAGQFVLPYDQDSAIIINLSGQAVR